MRRTPFVAGNWKLNLSPANARALAASLASGLADVRDVTIAVFPTALSVPAVLDVLRGSPIGVGVQEVEVSASGAYTGANSAAIAREVGCEYFLAGHSERRQLYGETDERVGQRLRAGLAAGLLPILCVGETLAERRAGKVDEVVHRQLQVALATILADQVPSVTIAYEPVWAIGTGETATPDQAQAAHVSIRSWLRGAYGDAVADGMRLQYGGSVKASNAAELLGCPDIDGALVGGASLDASGFAEIVRAAQR